jgi:hypothetical protein
MKRPSYPTVEKILSAFQYPNLQEILDDSPHVSKDLTDPLDGVEWGLHIFDESINPADTEPDMGMRGMGQQINRMGG